LRFYYVIDTDAKLFVEAESGCSETELSSEDAITRTFVDGFEAAWGRLCKACRNTLVTFWRANAPDSHPSLELADVELAGGYNYRDYAFRFQREAVKLAQEAGVLVDLVGHELGHSWWHTQQPNCHLTRDDLPPQAEEKEAEANVQARRWGFDMKRLINWANKNLAALGYNQPFPDSFLGPDNLDDFVPYTAPKK